MLAELRIRDLGVIVELELSLEAGMTAVTGETGAGKTMLVEAIELLVGGRADGVLVRSGADEAWVEGRFLAGDGEVVLARAVPSGGRSRAYVDGRMAPASALAEAGRHLVDLHGQHTHQSLLAAAEQRGVLDAFGKVDVAPVMEARARLRAVEEELAGLGGDRDARAREADLLRYQVAELEAAGLTDADEDVRLAIEEDRLADAAGHREAASLGHHALAGEGGAADAIGSALAALARRAPFVELEDRLRGLSAEVAEAASELRAAAEGLDDDPEQLDRLRARRQLLRELRRKYGGGAGPGDRSLTEVLRFAEQARLRLDELERHGERAVTLEAKRGRARAALEAAEAAVGAARRAVAPDLEQALAHHLHGLAMPQSRFEVRVGDEDPGDQVSFLLGANPGEPALPLSKVASGGELARAMLAVRLVLQGVPAGSPGHAGGQASLPPTMVFDEVDAGVGGEAALAVGRALAALAPTGTGEAPRQVLVVTHLPQVAAFADHQVAVAKAVQSGRTVARAGLVSGEARVAELSRMLSGQPASPVARRHAEELLAVAARERGW